MKIPMKINMTTHFGNEKQTIILWKQMYINENEKHEKQIKTLISSLRLPKKDVKLYSNQGPTIHEQNQY
jgi:hypothetical protein